jgi:hypothetical protein
MRDPRIPAGESIPQSISRFFFKALAMNIALAGSVPAVSAGKMKKQQVVRNPLWQKELQISRLKIPPRYYPGCAMLDIFFGIATGSFWPACEFLNIPMRKS